jgi:hypothetical protein
VTLANELRRNAQVAEATAQAAEARAQATALQLEAEKATGAGRQRIIKDITELEARARGLEAKASRVEGLQSASDAAVKQIQELQAQLAKAQRQLSELRTTLQQREAALARLDATLITVPQTVGMPQAEAETRLKAASLVVGRDRISFFWASCAREDRGPDAGGRVKGDTRFARQSCRRRASDRPPAKARGSLLTETSSASTSSTRSHGEGGEPNQDQPRPPRRSRMSFVRKFLGEELFTKRFPRLPWAQLVDASRPKAADLVGHPYGAGLALVGLNSCVYETNQDHYGFVGGAQLDLVEELLEEDGQGRNAVRVAVMHHHLHPFPEPLASGRAEEQMWQDMSTIRDAGLSERRLERLASTSCCTATSIKPSFEKRLFAVGNEASGTNRLIVCGAGSTGVNALELGHNDSNHYEVIEILRSPRRAGADFLRIEWRELALRSDAEWVTAERWTVSG